MSVISDMKLGTVIALFLAFLSIGVSWEVYKFHDCRNVGHSKLYCIGNIGK